MRFTGKCEELLKQFWMFFYGFPQLSTIIKSMCELGDLCCDPDWNQQYQMKYSILFNHEEDTQAQEWKLTGMEGLTVREY